MPVETCRCSSIVPSTKWECLTSKVVPGFGAGAQIWALFKRDSSHPTCEKVKLYFLALGSFLSPPCHFNGIIPTLSISATWWRLYTRRATRLKALVWQLAHDRGQNLMPREGCKKREWKYLHVTSITSIRKMQMLLQSQPAALQSTTSTPPPSASCTWCNLHSLDMFTFTSGKKSQENDNWWILEWFCQHSVQQPHHNLQTF